MGPHHIVTAAGGDNAGQLYARSCARCNEVAQQFGIELAYLFGATPTLILILYLMLTEFPLQNSDP